MIRSLKRLALPNSEILIHQPLIGGGGISGQTTDVKIHADHLVYTRDKMNRLLSEMTGQSLGNRAGKVGIKGTVLLLRILQNGHTKVDTFITNIGSRPGNYPRHLLLCGEYPHPIGSGR